LFHYPRHHSPNQTVKIVMKGSSTKREFEQEAKLHIVGLLHGVLDIYMLGVRDRALLSSDFLNTALDVETPL